MHRMRCYPPTIQLELFCPRPQAPTWDQIPPEVRQKTVFLLAQMLREHRELHAAAERREARRE